MNLSKSVESNIIFLRLSYTILILSFRYIKMAYTILLSNLYSTHYSDMPFESSSIITYFDSFVPRRCSTPKLCQRSLETRPQVAYPSPHQGKILIPFEIIVLLILLVEKHQNVLIAQQPDHASIGFSLISELNLSFTHLWGFMIGFSVWFD